MKVVLCEHSGGAASGQRGTVQCVCVSCLVLACMSERSFARILVSNTRRWTFARIIDRLCFSTHTLCGLWTSGICCFVFPFDSRIHVYLFVALLHVLDPWRWMVCCTNVAPRCVQASFCSQRSFFILLGRNVSVCSGREWSR